MWRKYKVENFLTLRIFLKNNWKKIIEFFFNFDLNDGTEHEWSIRLFTARMTVMRVRKFSKRKNEKKKFFCHLDLNDGNEHEWSILFFAMRHLPSIIAAEYYLACTSLSRAGLFYYYYIFIIFIILLLPSISILIWSDNSTRVDCFLWFIVTL